MALDPNRWTIKTQEAFTQAMEAARPTPTRRSRPTTCLAALLRQEDGVVLPILTRVGKQPLTAAQRGRRGRRQAAQGVRLRCSSVPRAAADLRWRRPGPRRDGRRVPVDRAPAAGPGRQARRQREDLLAALQEVRGSHRITSQNPEEQYQALEKYGRDLTEAARQGQARPGHRPRRRDPPGDPGALAPHQEQPGADRRARRRQDRHRRGAWPGASSKATCPRASRTSG